MRKTALLLAAMLMLTGTASPGKAALEVPTVTSPASTVDSEADGPIFLGLSERMEISATGPEVYLPRPTVYDETDVNLSWSVSVFEGESELEVRRNAFFPKRLGNYAAVYRAQNSAGRLTECRISLEIVDKSVPILYHDYEVMTVVPGRQYKVPEIHVTDYHEVSIQAALRRNGDSVTVGETFTAPDEEGWSLHYTATEEREDALSAEFKIALLLSGGNIIYGFDDYGAEDGLYWNAVQSDLSTTDPEKYQVPRISGNSDPAFVHDEDGKSFLVEIEGKEDCSPQTSWPAILTSDLKLGNLSDAQSLVFWLYNASEDDAFSELTFAVELNFKYTYSGFVAPAGKWTKISVPLESIKDIYGNSTLGTFKIFTYGFSSGTAKYYIDDMKLI